MLNVVEHTRLVEVVWILVTARAVWLLPDWLWKWQHLLAVSRNAPRRRRAD